MLYWAVTFFLVSLVAAVLGFGGIAWVSASVAQALFFVFLAFFVLSIIFHVANKDGRHE